MSKILFQNKVNITTDTNIDLWNKVMDDDMNEIKTVVNLNDTAQTAIALNLSNLTARAGAVPFTYVFDSSTSATSPTSGTFRLNNTNPSLATAIYISEDDQALYIKDFIDVIVADSFIYIKDRGNDDIAALYKVVSVTYNTSWYTIVVVNSDASAAFTNGAECAISFILKGESGTGSGTVTSVTAGSGLVQTAPESPDPVLSVGSGTGIETDSNSVSVRYSNIIETNFIEAATDLLTTPIDTSDILIYSDTTDGIVKKGRVTQLPFASPFTVAAGLDYTSDLISPKFGDLPNVTGSITGTDALVVVDNGFSRKTSVQNTNLSPFINDLNWTDNDGTVVSVTAGTGMTQTGDINVNPTLNVIASFGLETGANDIYIKYDGTNTNLIDVLPSGTEGNPISLLDSIMYHDDTSQNVAKGLISDLPFTNNEGTVTDVLGGTGLTSVDNGGGSFTLNLDDTTVTPTSYTRANITVDAQGRITAASSSTSANTWRPVTAGGNTLGSAETLAFTAGANITISESAGAVTINSPTVTVADESADIGTFVTFTQAATGEQALKTGTNLTFNSSTGKLTATSFLGSGATLTDIPNSALDNSTISGISLGGTLGILTAGTGLTGSSYNGSTSPVWSLDFGELTDTAGNLIATDHLIAHNGTAEARQLISDIPLSIFNNDEGWTDNIGTMTYFNVTANNGLSNQVGHGNTVDFNSGTGIVVSSTISVNPDLTFALDYLGANNFIESATDESGIAIATGDLIAYSDVNDSNEVKQGQVSDLPFIETSEGLTKDGSSDNVTNYYFLTQAEYDLIGTPSDSIVYFITSTAS